MDLDGAVQYKQVRVLGNLDMCKIMLTMSSKHIVWAVSVITNMENLETKAPNRPQLAHLHFCAFTAVVLVYHAMVSVPLW